MACTDEEFSVNTFRNCLLPLTSTTYGVPHTSDARSSEFAKHLYENLYLVCRHTVINRIPFYRAIHYSAKRGLEIACRLSVSLSVTLVDHDHIG